MSTLLEIRELTKEYTRGGKHGREFEAVNHAAMTVDRGEFVCIRGVSGSGKSTLLNMIAGLTAPTSGDILLEGQSILGLDDAGISRIRNEKIGYVPQGQTSLANLTVLDNVRLPFFFMKREGDPTDRAQELLDKVGIGHLADAYPKELSGGEQRRIAIARALINDPDMLILDEPTSDLDPQTTIEILNMIRGVAKGGTSVIMVTHDASLAAEEFDALYHMKDGVLTRA